MQHDKSVNNLQFSDVKTEEAPKKIVLDGRKTRIRTPRVNPI